MLETMDIKDVEIFAVGKWNGDNFKDEDLDSIVEAYNSNKDAYSPFIKLGHDEAQALAKKSGIGIGELPALGWMDNIRKIGQKIVADFKNVPKKVAELMKVGAYRARSAELWENIEFGGKKWPFMLKAIGLLGAEAPAVSGLNTLDDIIALYGAEKARAFETQAEVKVYQLEPTALTKGDVMNEEMKKMASEVAEATKKLAEQEDLLREADKALAEAKKALEIEHKRSEELAKCLESEKFKAEKAESEMAKFNEEKRINEIKTEVESLISDGKLAPAQKEFAINLLTRGLDGAVKFNIEDKELTAKEMLFSLIGSGKGVTLSTGPSTGAGRANREDVKDGVVGIELDKKAKEYSEKHKVSYREAYIAVSREAQA